jgi:hypothetical protein
MLINEAAKDHEVAEDMPLRFTAFGEVFALGWAVVDEDANKGTTFFARHNEDVSW